MRGEVEMNPRDLSKLVEGVGVELERRSGGALAGKWERRVGGAGETGRGGHLLVGVRGKVPIETSKAVPTHGGASRTDFAKVSPGQRGAGEVHPLRAGAAL